MTGIARGFILWVLLVVASAGIRGFAQESREYPFGRGVVRWVSTQWLQDHLKDPNLAIVDTQADVYDYLAEHIQGAVYLSDFTLRAARDNLPVDFLSSDGMRLLFRRIGLNNDTPVVVYTAKGAYTGSGSGLGQTMMAYALARFGHNRVYVLDGGLDKWKQEGRPLTQEFPKVKEGRFRPVVRNEYFIDMEELKKTKDRGDVVLLDARPAKTYQGKGPWIKEGHIPGAVSLPWRSLMADDNAALMKSDDEINKMLKEHNVSPDKTVIVYCGTGREATSEFLLFKWYLGYPNVKIYEGSFTEWCAHSDNPTVAGVSPR